MTNGEKFKEVFGFGADGSRVIAVNATWWDCEFQNRKPITNADRIRSLSDEELADSLCDISGGESCPFHFGCNESCRSCCLEWLKQEVEE